MTRAAVVGAVLAVVLALGACGDDGPAADDEATEDSIIHTPTTEPPRSGGIDVPAVEGTYPVAVPSLGFGIAVPGGWQATLLSEDAIRRLEGAALADESFLDAARTVAASGAVFYAAGADTDGRVGDLKIDVRSDADTSPAAVRAAADAVVDRAGVEDAVVVDDLPAGRVRVDFVAEQPAADGSGPVQTLGSQIFVPDGARLWSLIVTSEDAEAHLALVTLFSGSFVVAPPS